MALELGGKAVKSDINVTPLVDVVLVLLIIFMVITPMLQRGQPVALPEARLLSRLTRGGDPLYLSVTKDARVYLDKQEVARSELARVVAAEVARSPGVALLLKADKDLDYRVVREVVRELAQARVGGVSLAASERKEAP